MGKNEQKGQEDRNDVEEFPGFFFPDDHGNGLAPQEAIALDLDEVREGRANEDEGEIEENSCSLTPLPRSPPP